LDGAGAKQQENLMLIGFDNFRCCVFSGLSNDPERCPNKKLFKLVGQPSKKAGKDNGTANERAIREV